MHFNTNGPVWQFVGTAVDFTLLNLVFLLTCLPVVTIGPAFAGLYSTLFAYDEHEDIRLTREYFKRFKREFWQGLAGWAFFLVFGAAVIFAIVFYWSALMSNAAYLVFPILIVGAVTILGGFEFYFPIQARFVNSFRRTLTLSLSCAWRLLGYSLLLIAIDVSFAAIITFTGMFRVIAVFFGFAWIFYAKSLILLHVFKKLDRASSHPEDGRPTNALGQ